MYGKGRSEWYVYLTFQQQMKASATAIPTLAYASAAVKISAFAEVTAIVARL